MDDYTAFIYDAWDKFTKTGLLVPGVKKEIGESWQRCRANGLNCHDGRGRESNWVCPDIKVADNSRLVFVARSIMENIYEIVKGSGFGLFLSDKDGYILDFVGDQEIMDKAEALCFVRGALWTEEAVGTNAIGTAMVLGKPIQTVGAEHYGKQQHTWTCSAAPIFDEDRNLLGCINMSGHYNQVHIHTLGIVITAAQNIQKQLELTESYHLLNTTFDSVSEGMIVLDRVQRIKEINDRACSILGIRRGDILKTDIDALIKNIDFADVLKDETRNWSNLEWDFHGSSSTVKCVMNVVPMRDNGKPIGMIISFWEAKQVHKLVNKMVGYKAVYDFEDFITQNPEMMQVIRFARKAAGIDCNILIEGESGTGKEVIAQSIHNFSKRNKGPFVAVNCASIPRELVESELFGYDRGAFTGAGKDGNPGKFELADGGTIFLDEIGELPLDIQGKLLRVLDNSKIARIGGTIEKQLDVRVICATNRTLKDEVQRRSFREDLYYRLDVVNITTIPLRYRREDVALIATEFVERLNRKSNGAEKKLNAAYINKLEAYDWPGNVRELRNVVERDYHFGEGDELMGMHPIHRSDQEGSKFPTGHKESPVSLKAAEENIIRTALVDCDGNILAASKALKISRATLYRKISRYGIIIQ